jgi:hypothetical protein
MVLHALYMGDLNLDLIFVQVSNDVQIVLLHLFLLDPREADQFIPGPCLQVLDVILAHGYLLLADLQVLRVCCLLYLTTVLLDGRYLPKKELGHPFGLCIGRGLLFLNSARVSP